MATGSQRPGAIVASPPAGTGRQSVSLLSAAPLRTHLPTALAHSSELVKTTFAIFAIVMSQPSCTFDTCCGCIELRTGCLIIGYLSLVADIIYLIVSLVILIGGGVVAAKGENENQQQAGVALLAVGVVFLLIVVFLLAFTIVLLVGVHKNKRGHVKAYLICSVVLLVLYTIGLLASFAGTIDGGTIASRIIGLLLSIYFLLVIRSYYYKMDDRKPAIYNAA